LTCLFFYCILAVMKQLLVLLGCCTILTVSVGCQGPAVLPPDIAGTWRAKESPWKIVLSPQGKVTSAVIPLGAVEVRPNRTSRIQGQKGEPGIFEAGDFEVYYDAEIRELLVSIEIKHVYLDMGRILEGTCGYFITGNVSENGEAWYADVFTSWDLAVLGLDPNSTAEEPTFKQIGVLRYDPCDGPLQFIFAKAENSSSKK
jgi:hypothetical protein